MYNKAVKDAIKRGCRLFPEFDMQGFRLVCTICNIPMDINDDTRLIDLETHIKSDEHLANTEKTRTTRAKAHQNKLNKPKSSPNQSIDKSLNKNGSSSSPFPSTSLQQPQKLSASTPSTAKTKGKGRTGRPRKVRPSLVDNPSRSATSDSIISESSSSSTFSSSSSYVTTSSTPITTKPTVPSKTKKKKNLNPKSPRDKIIILSDDTQESVYLSDPDEGELKSKDTDNTESKINAQQTKPNSRDVVNPNQMESSSSSSDPLVKCLKLKSDPTEVPSTSTEKAQANPVDTQICGLQNESQIHSPTNESPTQSIDSDNGLKDDCPTDTPVEPMVVTSSDATMDATSSEANAQESTLISGSEPTLKPGDSLLVPMDFVPSSFDTLPLALTYPMADLDSNQNVSGNIIESDDADKTIATPNEVPQTSSTPGSESSEKSVNAGTKKLRQRKRKQEPSVKEEPMTPSKTPRPYVRKKSADQLDNHEVGGDPVKSRRKMGRKRKQMRIHEVFPPSPPTIDTVSPITASDDNVNPLERVNSTEKSEPADCSESIISMNSNLNSSNLFTPSPCRELTLMPPPISMSMATNEVTTTNSNSLDGGELDQRSRNSFNTTYNINTNGDTTSMPNDSTGNSMNETKGVIKKEAEVQCEFMNVTPHHQPVKPEPSGPNDEYQSVRQEFYADLIKFSLNTNISFEKLTGSESRSFFHKNFGVSIPHADELKTRVLQPLQRSKMDKLKEIVANHNIYLIMKIHQNEERGHILTIMVGVLNGQPAQTYLYKLSIIQEVDLTVLSRELLNALHNLYQGLVFEKLSLLITDESPLMGRIANFLKTLHPKVRHITCLYQVCDDIGEQFRKTHPYMQSFVSTINGFLFSAPEFLSKFRSLTTRQKDLPIPASKLHGFNWMMVAGDLFEEYAKITHALEVSMKGSNKESYLVKVNSLLENKELQREWIDYKGYVCLEATVDLLKSDSLSLTQMQRTIERLGRNPKRSVIVQRIKDLMQSCPSFDEMLSMGGKIANDENDPSLKLFNYAPLSTLASFNCYETFLSILKENGGSLEDSLLETLTFLTHNKDL